MTTTTTTTMMVMIGRRPLATNPMDRTGDFSCFVFLCLCFAKLPSLSPLTSSSAEPMVTDFMFFFFSFFFCLFFLKCGRAVEPLPKLCVGRQALKAPFTAVLQRFQSLLLNLFSSTFFFFFFLTVILPIL